MAVKNFNGLRTETIFVNQSNNVYNVKEGATVIGGGDYGELSMAGIAENNEANPALKNNIFNIDGTVMGSQVGIYTFGKNAEINVGKPGLVVGSYGIATSGNDTHVTNHGVVSAGMGYGISSLDGAGFEVRNFGIVNGAAGVFTYGGGVLVLNGEGGKITGAQYGVGIGSDIGTSSRIVNHGRIEATSGDGASVAAGEGNEKLINDGSLLGNVVLGSGKDLFDNRGGKVEGTIELGEGNDTLIVDNAKYKMIEVDMGGTDTVRASVSYTLNAYVENLTLLGKGDMDGKGNELANTLRGNTGDNDLRGMAGMDELFGGKGKDRLFGGADADVFHFSNGNGTDRIMDFVQGEDLIDVSGWDGIGNLAQLKNNAVNDDGNVVITRGTDVLIIHDISKNELLATDFDFG